MPFSDHSHASFTFPAASVDGPKQHVWIFFAHAIGSVVILWLCDRMPEMWYRHIMVPRGWIHCTVMGKWWHDSRQQTVMLNVVHVHYILMFTLALGMFFYEDVNWSCKWQWAAWQHLYISLAEDKVGLQVVRNNDATREGKMKTGI